MVSKTYQFEKEASENSFDIYSMEAPFDVFVNACKSNSRGMSPASCRDLGLARLVADANGSLWTKGSYVREGALMIPSRLTDRSFPAVVLLEKAPIFRNPLKAVAQNKKHDLFYHSDSFARDVFNKARAWEQGYLLLDYFNLVDISQNEVGKFLFGDIIQKYSARGRDVGLLEPTIDLGDLEMLEYVDEVNRAHSFALFLGNKSSRPHIFADSVLYKSDLRRAVVKHKK